MRTFSSEQALVAAYWRKLARSIERPGIRKSRAASPVRRRNSERLRRRVHAGVAA